MKIAIVLSPGAIFDRDRPNSIETVVRALNEESDDKVLVICDEGATATEVMNVAHIPRTTWNQTRVKYASKYIEEFKPDLIEFHQNAIHCGPIAQRFKAVPSVLYRHNFLKKRSGLKNKLYYGPRYRKFSAHIFVSDAVRDQFINTFPDLQDLSYALANPIDFSSWYAPLHGKKNLIAFSGRAMPEKGLQYLVPALIHILDEHPDWRACLCLGDLEMHKDWALPVIAPLQNHDRCELREHIPLGEVKKVFAAAKIAIVPSVWAEPFGLVAIEAHAAGAALISSGTGGLKEASGDSALYLEDVTVRHIYEKLKLLIENEPLRSELAIKGQDYVRANHDTRIRRRQLREIRQDIIQKVPADESEAVSRNRVRS